MSTLKLTKTKMKQGVWQGIVTQTGSGVPVIDVTHVGITIPGVELTHNESAGHWLLSIPIPADAITDGVQTLLITDKAAGAKIGHISLIAGEPLMDDVRAELDLLRAELDMLKRAFRRHCLETS